MDAVPEKLYLAGMEGANIGIMQAFDMEFTTEGGLVVIQGDNNQGKTSCMNTLAYVLGGAALIPKSPIRQGELSARATIKLSDGQVIKYVATRIFEVGGDSKLTVMDESGVAIKSPQSWFNTIISNLTFDPVTFMRLKEKDQLAALLSLPSLNLDTEKIAKLEQQGQAAYNERTVVNRNSKQAKAVYESLPPAPMGTPAELISVSDLSAKLEAANAVHSAVLAVEAKMENGEAHGERLDKEIAEIEARLTERKEAKAKLEAVKLELVEQLKQAEDQLAKHDIDNLRKSISEADEINRQVDQAKKREAAKAEYLKLEQDSKALTAKIDKAAAAKEGILAAANMPIPDLNFNENGILYKGLPLNQASSSEQLRVAMSIAMAGNPVLRAILLPDASLLDDKSIAAINEMAEKNDFKVIGEFVGKNKPVGFVIEAGRIIEVREEKPADA